MGFGTDETGEQGFDENGIAGEDEEIGVNITVEDWVVNPTFSEVSLSNTIPIDITVEDWVVNPTFSEALLSNPIEITVEDWVVNPTFSEALLSSSLIEGIININIEVIT